MPGQHRTAPSEAIVVVVLVAVAIYNYLQIEQPRRWWPVSNGDWPARGTWLSSALAETAVAKEALLTFSDDDGNLFALTLGDGHVEIV